MVINSCLKKIKELKQSTENSSKIKIYDEFENIFKNLESFNLGIDKINSIESKFNDLNLNRSKNDSLAILKRKLSDFLSYLYKEYLIVKQDHYMTIWLFVWMMIWIVWYNIFSRHFWIENDVSSWLIFWMLFWMFFWHLYDKKAVEENRVIKKIKA